MRNFSKDKIFEIRPGVAENGCEIVGLYNWTPFHKKLFLFHLFKSFISNKTMPFFLRQHNNFLLTMISEWKLYFKRVALSEKMTWLIERLKSASDLYLNLWNFSLYHSILWLLNQVVKITILFMTVK